MPNSFIRDYYNELSGVDLEYNELTEAAKRSPNKYGKLYPIYIVLFSNRNDFSMLIRKVTKSAYSHSAVSLDSTMNNMYSFSDVPYDAGVFGALGFVRESIWSPQYRNCEHFRVLVSFIDKAGRDAAQKKIDWFIKNYDKYTYNTIGLIQYYLKGKNTKNHDETKKSRFFCSEFVSYMIDATEEVEGFENILQSPADLSVTRNAIDLGIYTVDGFDEEELIKRTLKAEKEFRKCDTLPEINLEESASVSTLSDAQLLNEAVAKIARKKVDKRAVQRYTYNIDWKKLYLKYIELFPDSDPNLRFELFCVIIKFYLMPKKAPTDNVTDQVVEQLEKIHNMMNGGFIKMIDSEDSVIFFKSNDGDDIINYPPKIKNESTDVLDEFIHTSQIEGPDERKAMMKKYGLRPAGYGQDTRKEDEERMKKSHEWEKKMPLRQKKKIYREDGEGLVPGHEEVGDPDDVLPIEETAEYRLTKGFNKTITLYHGSPIKLSRIDAKSINLGTRISAPRSSSFWSGNKDAAAIRGLNAWMCDNIYDFYTSMDAFENIAENALYVNKSEYDALCKKIKNCTIYVHEVTVPTKYVGRGHDPILKEYTLDIPVYPRRVFTYTYADLVKFIKPVNDAELAAARKNKNKTSIIDKLLYADMDKRGEAVETDLRNAYGKLTLPKEPKPTADGWYGNNHVWNSLIVKGRKRYRERVEVLVHREDKVLLRIKPNSTYTLPGGSSEPTRSLKDQAIKECQEEVHITPKDLIYYGSYVKPYTNNQDYDWYLCHYFVGKYDKPYTGKVRKEDQDDKMLNESKWYPLGEVDTLLSDEHMNALHDYWKRTLSETAVSDDTKGTDQDFHNVGKAAGWYKGWTADGCQFDLEGVAQDNDAPDSGADGAYRVEAPVDSQDEPWLGTVHNLNNPDKSVNESMIKRDDYIEFNFEKWSDNSDHNAIYITGLSGSGKTTLGNKLAKEYNATYVNLDHFMSVCRKGKEHLSRKISENTWTDISIYKKYFTENPDGYIPRGDRVKTLADISRDEVGIYYLRFSKWFKKLLKTPEYRGKRYVVEGVHIYEFESYELYRDEPVVVMNAGLLKALFRRERRGLGVAKEKFPGIGPIGLVIGTIKDSVTFAIPMYINQEPVINKFRSGMIAANTDMNESVLDKFRKTIPKKDAEKITNTVVNKLKAFVKPYHDAKLQPSYYGMTDRNKCIMIEMLDINLGQYEREGYSDTLKKLCKKLEDDRDIKRIDEIKSFSNGDGDEGCIYVNLKHPVDDSISESTDNIPDKILADPTNPTMVDKYRKLGYEFDPSRGTIRGRAQYMYYGVKINEPAEEPRFTIDIDQSGKGICTDTVIKKLKTFIESRLNRVSTDNPEDNASIAKELLYAVDLIETYLINNVDKRSVYYCELINLRTLAIDFVAKVTETDATVVRDYEQMRSSWNTVTDGKLTTML